MYRIAIAGFQHETNTFAPTKTGYTEFAMADSWPQLLTGHDVLAGTRGINLPIAGFVSAAQSQSEIELVPLLWCAAEPSGHVTDDAFDRISTTIISGICNAGPLDGVYLDLHGAMVTETHDDGEGELIRRVREVVGNSIPIAISLDLHANITTDMVARTTSIALFRTYPHLDMADTGARSCALLMSHLENGAPKKAFRQAPFLIPLSAQYTGDGPCRGIYDRVVHLSNTSSCSTDVALGFTAADVHDAGPSVVAYAPKQEQADEIADDILAVLLRSEHEFDCTLLSPFEAVRQAMRTCADRPVIIADVQDNPGAGATSDTTGLLTALVEEGAQGAVLGLMHDPEIATKAHGAGIGAIIEGALGGKSGLPGQSPYHGRFRVIALGDGNCTFTGEMYDGSIAVLGSTAVLSIEGVEADVQVVVTSNRSQCLDLALFTHIGVDPKAARIVCVKSTVHFRADFDPIAERILSTAAPGLFPCQLEDVPYRRLRKGIRLGPMGAAFQPDSR